MVEEKAWKELHNGAEREARVRQDQKLIDQYKHTGIKVKDMTIRAQNKMNHMKGRVA